MPREWHDINSPGFAFTKKKVEPSAQPVTFDQPAPTQQQQKDTEVEFIKAETWEPGQDGYQFNKECSLTVEAKFLKDTARKKITGSLFVKFNNEEEDLNSQVEAFLDNDGSAKFKVKLWYGNAYYNALNNNPDAKCSYIVKNIKHSRGKNTIESEMLEMPNTEKISLGLRLNINPNDEESQDDKFTLYSTDESRSYSKTLTVKDDRIPGNNYLDLKFNDLSDSLNYTLEVDPGKEGMSYKLFENSTLKDIVNG